MVEMTPEHLEAQVDMELQEADDDQADAEVVTDFSTKLIEKLTKDNKNKPGEGLDSQQDVGPSLPVDPLSLSSLLSQGFEEGPARQALRKHQNDTQAALDWLVGGGDQVEAPNVEDGVRMPTTVKRVQRLKARRRAQQERRKRQGDDEEDKEAESKDDSPEKGASDEAAPPPAAPPICIPGCIPETIPMGLLASFGRLIETGTPSTSMPSSCKALSVSSMEATSQKP